jgi:hypothetical protein
MAYVYRHIRLDKNEPFYIGIGSDNDGKYTRANRKTQRGKYWTNIVKKTEYVVEIIEDDLTWNDAIIKEMWWINFYGRIDNKKGPLINHTDGGDGMIGWRPSEETLKHLSNVRKGRVFRNPGFKISEEQKEKIRKSRTGVPPSNKGVPLTPEQREKISISKKGIPSEKRKPVICIETGEVFASIEHAEKDPRFYRGAISKVLSGLRENAKGFHFKYY